MGCQVGGRVVPASAQAAPGSVSLSVTPPGEADGAVRQEITTYLIVVRVARSRWKQRVCHQEEEGEEEEVMKCCPALRRLLSLEEEPLQNGGYLQRSRYFPGAEQGCQVRLEEIVLRNIQGHR